MVGGGSGFAKEDLRRDAIRDSWPADSVTTPRSFFVFTVMSARPEIGRLRTFSEN
jgi:hypothetical protein